MRAKAKIDAGMVIGIKRCFGKWIAVFMQHAHRLKFRRAVKHLPVERCEQRRRRRAVKATIVVEDPNASGQCDMLPRL